MAKRASRKKRPTEEHTFLGLQVQQYEASVGASINHYAHAPQSAWDLDDQDPVYKFTLHLRIKATSVYPEERANESYELSLYANDSPSQRLNVTLRDIQVRDKHGSPQYRPYRGKQVPIYSAPKGLGFLDKIRGESRWTAALFVPGHFGNDMLTLLAHKRPLFVSIHESKDGRDRWVRSMSLQTNDPAEE